jgi:DNA adenine methylase
MKPILKWAGGKYKLSTKIINKLNYDYEKSTYVEPFAGGLSVLFKLMPKKAIVSDSNSELINFYITLRDELEKLIRILRILNKNNKKKGEDFYYKIRSIDRNENYKDLSKVFKAARLLYLNKTCYNGLFRVSKKGYFNTPFGFYTKPKIIDLSNLRKASIYLNSNDIRILNKDYKKIIKFVNSKSIVYLDPPYFFENRKSFVGYTKKGFDLKETKKFKLFCDELIAQGARVVISNDANSTIRELYLNNGSSKYEIFEIESLTSVGSSSLSRKKVKEVLICGPKK